MATYVELLKTRAAAIMAELAALSTSAAGGLPNVTLADGGTAIDHQGYKKGLYEELDSICKSLGVKNVAELANVTDSESLNYAVETFYED